MAMAETNRTEIEKAGKTKRKAETPVVQEVAQSEEGIEQEEQTERTNTGRTSRYGTETSREGKIRNECRSRHSDLV